MSRKDMQPLLRELQRQGFAITKTKANHLKISRNGRKVQIAATPSDYRSVRNMVTRLKRIGYVP